MLIAYAGLLCVCAVAAQADTGVGAERRVSARVIIPGQLGQLQQASHRPRMVVRFLFIVMTEHKKDRHGGRMGFIVV